MPATEWYAAEALLDRLHAAHELEHARWAREDAERERDRLRGPWSPTRSGIVGLMRASITFDALSPIPAHPSDERLETRVRRTLNALTMLMDYLEEQEKKSQPVVPYIVGVILRITDCLPVVFKAVDNWYMVTKETPDQLLWISLTILDKAVEHDYGLLCQWMDRRARLMQSLRFTQNEGSLVNGTAGRKSKAPWRVRG